MNQISRRNFIKKSANVSSGLVVCGSNGIRIGKYLVGEIAAEIKVNIPMPLQVVIDDVGWWSGEDGSKKQEPYRTGISRNHLPADYTAIVELGRALGIRPQAAFVLCEWDRNNILRQVPTSTWMGNNWDNSKWVGPWLDEAADIIRKSQQYIELTVHGIGHEYWEGGSFTRAEWTDSKGIMRPHDQVEKHLEYYGKLMDQNRLGLFPFSFVPAAFRHCFGKSDGREISLAEILYKWGIKYINTPLKSMFKNESVKDNLFCIDSGVMTVDRGEDQFPWLTFPAYPVDDLKGPTCGMHWPNLLHPDPERNIETVACWVKYLRQFDERPDMILARNSEAFQEQLIHRELTKINVKDDSVELDFTGADKLPVKISKNKLTLKIQAVNPLKFVSSGLEISPEPLRKNEGFQYRLNIERKSTEVRSVIRIERLE